MTKTFSLQNPTGAEIRYTDRKRHAWAASLLMPLFPLSGIALYLQWQQQWLLAMPLLATYTLLPLLDHLLGTDSNNPPEAIVPQLEADRYYRWLTWLTVPMHFVVLIAMAAFVGTQALSPWSVLVLAITAGSYSGLGINTAHELGHKKPAGERLLARIVLAVPAYGHFCIEHNAGHHRDVATPVDPASARMGESIYRFMLREVPGAFRRGWQIEKGRLQRTGQSVWSHHNHILQSYALSALLQGGLIIIFGWIMLPFLIIHNVWAWFQLTSANYIEHYGLLRAQTADGHHERCQPHHSWNANHLLSNLTLFHLERHSDHHANPMRRYQSLRNFDDIPQLPTGYFGMYLLAYVPWLWFRVMDPRLLALPHVQGQLERVNIAPARRTSIAARYSAVDETGNIGNTGL